MQNPTVSRIVHFFPASSDPLGPGPLAAIVSRVWSPTCINLGVFDGNGNSHSRTSVLFHQEGAPKPAVGYATWPAREGVLLEAKMDSTTGGLPLPPLTDDTAIELRISEVGANVAPRVTKADIDALMGRVVYTYDQRPNGSTTTFCHAFLDGSFFLATGMSAAVSAENFNAELGQDMATNKAFAAARDKLWELEGYRLHRSLQGN